MPIHKKPTQMELLGRRRKMHEAVAAHGLPWAACVRSMRASMGMTQAEFARTFHMTVRQVAEFENGRGNPTVATLCRLGRAFGYEVGFLLRQPQDSAMRSPAGTRTPGLGKPWEVPR